MTTVSADDVPDVLTLGRLGVDLYPMQDGVGLADVETFGKFLGGTAANVSVAVARYGHRAALVSRVGDDPFGRFLLRELTRFGVDARCVRTDPSLMTPVTFCEIFPPDHFPLFFYRQPKAPDLNLTMDDLNPAAVVEAPIVWCTVTGLSQEPSRSTHHAVLAARARRQHTILDLDYRPGFWPSAEEARDQIAQALPLVTVAVGNRDECEVAVGETDPHRAADALLERGVEMAIVKQGPHGVLAKTRETTVALPSHPVRVVNGLGAGDAFGGALCHGLLLGWDIATTLTFANAAGALVASRRQCAAAMPTSSEVEALLSGH